MQKVVFRIPTPALLAAGLALVCVTPVAWAAPGLQALYLLPLGFALWVVRNRTAVDGERIVARSTFGTRELPWTDVKAIKVDPKGWLSAVLEDDSLVRLPAVRAGHLPALSAVSGGRVADPTAVPAPDSSDSPGGEPAGEPEAGSEGRPEAGSEAGSGGASPDPGATPPPVKSDG